MKVLGMESIHLNPQLIPISSRGNTKVNLQEQILEGHPDQDYFGIDWQAHPLK